MRQHITAVRRFAVIIALFVGAARGEVQVMQGDQDGEFLGARQVADQLQQAHLVFA